MSKEEGKKPQPPRLNRGRGRGQTLKPQKGLGPALKSRPKQKVANPYFRKVTTQMVAPGSAGSNVVVSPSAGSQAVCARNVHKELDIDGDDYPNGFTIVVTPDFETPSYISATAAQVLPAAAGVLAIKGESAATAASGSEFPFTGVSHDEKLIVQNELVTYDGHDWMKLNIEQTGTTHVAIHLEDKSTAEGAYQIIFGATDFANPVEIIATMEMSQGATTSEKFTIAADSTAFLWRFVTTGDPSLCLMNLHFSEAQLSADAQKLLNPAFSKFATDNGVKNGRVCSIGALLSNTTPILNKGGSVNAARVPNGFNPFADVVGSISSLPDNRRYQNTLEKGAYVFWVPSQLDEYEIDGINNKHRQYSESERIVIRCSGYPAGCSFKLHVNWIVEFYTPNQLFEKILPPPLTPEFIELFRVIGNMPAAMCNPAHDNNAQETLKSWSDTGAQALSYIKSGVDFAEKYGPYIYEAAMVLAALL